MSETESTTQDQAMVLVENSNDLAIHLHRLFAEAKGNVFFSPFYISATMALVLGEAEARGKEFADDMKINDIISAYQEQISTLLKNKESYIFTSANSVLNQTGFDIQEQYKAVLVESFKALIVDVDTEDDASEVVGRINEWVDEKTNGLIPKQIDYMDPTAGLVFLTAVYFKGAWLHSFDEILTFPQNFYNNGSEDQAKIVYMMHMKEYLLFAENESFQALQLPFAGEEIAMLVLLPRNMEGLEALEATITPSIVEDLSRDMCEKKVDVAIPRFHLEYSQCMDYSKHSGINNILNPNNEVEDANDFASQIRHKAVLEVDEGCTEDAAILNGSSEKCDDDYDTEVIIDHPFVFAIYDVKSSLMIFIGRVEEL